MPHLDAFARLDLRSSLSLELAPIPSRTPLPFLAVFPSAAGVSHVVDPGLPTPHVRILGTFAHAAGRRSHW